MAKTAAATARRALDRRLHAVPSRELATPRGGWVRAVREALGMTAVNLAARMQISEGAVRDLERAERNGGISLDRLRRAAEAMNCELIYVLVPRTSLAQTVEQQARMKALDELRAVDRTMSLEAQDTNLAHDRVGDAWPALVDTPQLWK